MFKKVTDNFSAYGQLNADLIRKASEDGYSVIINNRPDFEEPGQPAAGDLQAVAEELGLSFHHIPITPGQITPGDVQASREILAQANGRVLGFCRSGMRSTCLWALSQAGETDADTLISQAAEAGYDISGLRSALGG